MGVQHGSGDAELRETGGVAEMEMSANHGACVGYIQRRTWSNVILVRCKGGGGHPSPAMQCCAASTNQRTAEMGRGGAPP